MKIPVVVISYRRLADAGHRNPGTDGRARS
jgi:hypothetical protein